MPWLPGAALYRKRLTRDLGVRAECGYHTQLTARERIAQLVDPGTFVELTGEAIPGGQAGWDTIGFGDQRNYGKSLAAAGEKSGEPEAVVFGTAEISGFGLIIAAMDFRFMGGSMGSPVGESPWRPSARGALGPRCCWSLPPAARGCRKGAFP